MRNLTYELIQRNLYDSSLDTLPTTGEPLTLNVHQTLTQDSTGTMVYLQLEAINPKSLRTELSVAYIDHNMLQSGHENADDHAFIASCAKKYGIIFSKPGNGICHQLHLDNFSKPGKVLIGSDSHTPTCGAMGMLAIGAGGLDVALGMTTGTYTIPMPKVIGIELIGKRKPWVSAKDVIFEVLRRLTVSGGTGSVLEYYGEGVLDLSLPERATITNMGAELGATTSLFPSDPTTLNYLRLMHRAKDYVPLTTPENPTYNTQLTLNLSELEPMVAKPHSPDHIALLSEVVGIKVDQVAIGSCTNGSFDDLMQVCSILKGKRIHPRVSLIISPGSSAVLEQLASSGALATLIASGARLLESGCGPCIGMGQAPKSSGISLRTFNRNFKGRCGTQDAQVYLVSPQIAALSALAGELVTPSQEEAPMLSAPIYFPTHGNLFIYPSQLGQRTDSTIEKGPNIKSVPIAPTFEDHLELTLNLVVGDHVTTDDIMPSNAKLLPYRSNVPKLSKHCFEPLDPEFSQRASNTKASLIMGGHTYGQGSSREHAALVPLYLGVRVVIAKSFARIHKANLINAGILPLTFDVSDGVHLHEFKIGVNFTLSDIRSGLECGRLKLTSKDYEPIPLRFEGSNTDIAYLLYGGALNYYKTLQGD